MTDETRDRLAIATAEAVYFILLNTKGGALADQGDELHEAILAAKDA